MTVPNSAGYHKHPKGPNFLLVVIAAVIALMFGLLAALLLLTDRGKKMLPLNHSHRQAQTQNLTPASVIAARDFEANSRAIFYLPASSALGKDRQPG